MTPDSSPMQAGPQTESLQARFNFDLDDASWMTRLREYAQTCDLGRIGSYDLMEMIGRGGQGVVFKARQPRTGRVVAIKRLSAGAFATPEMRDRFQREVEAASALEHPGIVTVFGSDVVDGQAVLAMQWIDGQPVHQWVRPHGTQQRSVREVLQLFVSLCDAMQHAHQRGVIHRDLKPSNILVDHDNQPHVLDFGLAKVQTNAAASLTITGDFLGTPLYAAPEQLGGTPGDVDIRTDVYSLGAVLYQCLTGQTLFTASGSLRQMLDAVQSNEPSPPSSVSGQLDGEIDAIVLKAVAKDKELRYPSVDSLRDDVQRYLRGEAVLAHPPSTVYRMRKFVRQHRGAVAASATFLLLLVGATAISTAFFFRSERERRRADTQLVESRRQQARAEKEARKAAQSSRFVTDMLARANRGRQKGNPGVTVREALDSAAAGLESGETNYEPEVEGSIRLTIGETYDGLGLPDLAEPHYRRSLELLHEAFGPEHLRVTDAMQKLGSFYRRQDRIQDAQAMLEGALRIREREITDPHDAAIADAQSSLAVLRRQVGNFEEAAALYVKALDGYRISLGPDNENVGTTLQNLGVLNMYWNRWDVAEDYLLQARAFFERNPPASESEIIAVKQSLAHVLSKRKDPAHLAMFREVHADLIRLHGRQHFDVGRSALALGATLYVAGETEEAALVLRDAVLYTEPNLVKSAIAAYVGYVFQGLGRADEAEAFLREAMAQREDSLGSSSPAISYFHLAIAIICIEQQRFAEAEQLLLPAWEGLQDWSAMGPEEKKSVLNRIIGLYERWDAAEPGNGPGEKISEWRTKLEVFSAEHPQSN